MPRRYASPLVALLALTTSLVGVALAQPRPVRIPRAQAFATTSHYQACTKSWAFACNIPAGNGHTYGTAHEQTMCSSYTFEPDGTFQLTGELGIGEHGTYRVRDGKVTLTTVREADPESGLTASTTTVVLPISPDGATIGTLKRVAR